MVSYFSLLDAIECGIARMPRAPFADSLPSGDMPIYRNLSQVLKERGCSLPRRGVSKAGDLDPLKFPPELQTAPRPLRNADRQDRGAPQRLPQLDG